MRENESRTATGLGQIEDDAAIAKARVDARMDCALAGRGRNKRVMQNSRKRTEAGRVVAPLPVHRRVRCDSSTVDESITPNGEHRAWCRRKHTKLTGAKWQTTKTVEHHPNAGHRPVNVCCTSPGRAVAGKDNVVSAEI